MKYLDNNGLSYFAQKIKAWLAGKQDSLISGTNIKTINNQSILGSGNISISGEGDSSFPTLGASFRIWDLGPGIYVTTTNLWTCYYYGATNTANKFIGSGTGAFVFIYEDTSVSYKQYFIVDNTVNVCLHSGYSNATKGEYNSFNLGVKYLTKNDCPYDIGDIYITTNSDDPSTKWVGTTWERIAKGKTLVGVDENDADFNTVEKTGGSKELQKHNHGVLVAGQGGTSTFAATVTTSNAKGNFNAAYGQSVGTGESGNLQPYFTCYIWKRTA